MTGVDPGGPGAASRKQAVGPREPRGNMSPSKRPHPEARPCRIAAPPRKARTCGDYVVNFNTDVSACSWTATPSSSSAGNRRQAACRRRRPRRRHRPRVTGRRRARRRPGRRTDQGVRFRSHTVESGEHRQQLRRRAGALLIRSAAATAPAGPVAAARSARSPRGYALVRSSSCSRSCAASSTSLWRHSAAR